MRSIATWSTAVTRTPASTTSRTRRRRLSRGRWGKKMGGETLRRALTSLLLGRPHPNQDACTYCGKAPKTKSSTRHLYSHHVPIVFVMCACGKLPAGTAAILEHMATVHFLAVQPWGRQSRYHHATINSTTTGSCFYSPAWRQLGCDLQIRRDW